MRILATILLLGISILAMGQRSINFKDGDHIYLLEDYGSIPLHHQVDYQNDYPGLISFYYLMMKDGAPVCEVFFDPQDYKTITTRLDKNGNNRVVAMVGKFNESTPAVSLNPDTQPIFYKGRVDLNQRRFLVIETPQFLRATSFKICTNNRVFIFVKHPRRPPEAL